MAQVFIPTQCLDLTAGVRQVEIAGATLVELLRELDRQFPGIAARLIAGDELIDGVAVSIDGSMSARGLQTAMSPASEVHFHPVISGG